MLDLEHVLCQIHVDRGTLRRGPPSVRLRDRSIPWLGRVTWEGEWVARIEAWNRSGRTDLRQTLMSERMGRSSIKSSEATRSQVRGSARIVLVLVLALVLAGPAGARAQIDVDPTAGDMPSETLRVVAWNIRHGRGMDGEVDLLRIAEVLRGLDADVITLQEVDDRTERTGGVDQVGVLAESLGYEGIHGPHREYQGGWYGNAVLTRLPVLDVRAHTVPPAGGSALTVLEVGVAVGGARVSVVSVHLAGSEAERLAQADSVRMLFLGRERPVVLAGDFNDWPDGPVVERLRRDWQVLEKSGSPLTYPADAPDREIDFVMVLGATGAAERDAPAVEAVEHRVVAERAAADHRPIVAVLRIR